MDSKEFKNVDLLEKGEQGGLRILRINLKTLTGQKIPIEVSYEPDVTRVMAIKRSLEIKNGAPPDIQRLIYCGKELLDDELISKHNITDECVIHLVLKQNNTNVNNDGIPQRYDGSYEAPPIPIFMPRNELAADGSSVRIRMILYLSRIVRMFAMIDAILYLIWGLSSWLVLFAVPLAIAGYYGAQRFDTRLTYLYLLSLFIGLSIRIYMIFVSDDQVFIFLMVITVIIVVYIIKIVIKFIQLTKSLTEEERNQLLLQGQYVLRYF